MTHQYDYLVIGSGFGGSVAALRLAEKGWRVALVEQGRRIGPEEIKAGKSGLSKLLWAPRLGLRGYFVQHVFRHVLIVGGVGVGGGSIVWGSVMLEPKDAFYNDPVFKRLGIDMRRELAPHFSTARRMLGVATNPRQTRQDELLRRTARRMVAESSFGPVPNAIYFGTAGETAPDPYFDGAGPERKGCVFCGGCLTGCEHGSKNSLYQNYLYLAEKRGANILPERKAERIEALPEGGYRVSLVSPVSGCTIEEVTATKVIVAAGVIGTLQLLFRNRDTYRTLPAISQTLGQTVRTNSEAITAILHKSDDDISDGTAISTDFHPDAQTHIIQNRFDHGYRFFRSYLGPMVDGNHPGRRALRTLKSILCDPGLIRRNMFMRDWEKHVSVLTVMQDAENALSLRYGRRWWWPFSPVLSSHIPPGQASPSYLPIANRATRIFAEEAGGVPLNVLSESLGGKSTTAHILSGCPMGQSAADSVIDVRHEVHGAPGLFVVDGSSVPANLGVNPSLTITAMAERFAALQPSFE
ncbi:GMC family oxidoreductase [Paraburkholderia acidicola]|uniref:Cholesterol oxidase n=1 Tax=Paraburkholderia acidicola TaxID=1912599 RepID=A0ABV1LYQ2_9BURK